MKGKLTTPTLAVAQPATDYSVDRVVLDFTRGVAFIELRHLSSEGVVLLQQTIEEPLVGLLGGLQDRILAVLRRQGAIN